MTKNDLEMTFNDLQMTLRTKTTAPLMGTFINHMSMVIGREGSSEMLKICSEQGGRGPVKCSEFAQTKKLEQKIAFYSH